MFSIAKINFFTTSFALSSLVNECRDFKERLKELLNSTLTDYKASKYFIASLAE